MTRSGKRRAVTIGVIAAIGAISGALAMSGNEMQAALAEKETLVFDNTVWNVKSGGELGGGSTIAIDKTSHAGDNKLFISTKKEYTDFHLQYKIQYGSGKYRRFLYRNVRLFR